MNHVTTARSFSQTNNTSRGLGLFSPIKKKYSISELIALGNSLHKNGKMEIAESAFRKVLEHEPNHAVAIHFLGVIAHQSGHLEDAVRLVKKAVNLAPNYKQAHNNLGNIYEALGKPEAAILSYRHALDLDAEYSDALFNLGIALRQVNKISEAEEVF